jgi:ABC-2 type transport system ATP-binding protein
MEEKNVAIQLHGLQKSYKKLQVLKGVDFDVARGSIFALLGSNGAGKTTIVKILTTLLKPDDGKMRVDGFDVLSQPARMRESISLTGQFANRIAILHEGTIIVSGTLEELRKMLPPAKVEYVERQPTLEEIFLAIVGSDKKEQR